MTALENAKALYLEGIRDGDYVNAINTYSGGRYIQHSTPVKDGKDGFIEFFADFVDRNPVRDIQILRGFQDGQYVFVNALQILNGGEFLYITADIFDSDDEGKLIEHWDIIEEIDDAASFDGPTEPTDLDATDANKAIVAELLQNDEECVEVHRLIGCGNFVAALVERTGQGAALAVIDLFSVVGGAVERRWAVTEEITPPDTWVNGGKF